MNVFSVFTGIGGFELGLPEEWNVVGMSEIDKHANAILRYRFPGVKNYGDIQKINYGELPEFDILVGGSPCQDLSIAGKREGLSGSRSGLFFDYIRVLRERNPHYFIWENVAGTLSSNEGRDFAEVISQFSETGYDVWWQVLDATWFGIPQHRERVFVLGTLGKRGFGKVFFKQGNNHENNALPEPEANTVTSRYRKSQRGNGSYVAESELVSQIQTLHRGSQPHRIYGTGGVSPTLHRHTGEGQITKVALPVLEPGFNTTRANGRRIKTNNEPSFTLRTGVHNGVAIPVRDLDRGNYNANGRKVKTDNESMFTLQVASHHGIYDGMKVRYLTPLECERLMGWPDEHTRYGINDKGEKYELSDNARYNLIGNGVVPQVVRGIISQILSVEEEENSDEVNFVSDYEVNE